MPITFRILIDPDLTRETRRIADALELIADAMERVTADDVPDEDVDELRELASDLRVSQDDLQRAVNEGQTTNRKG